MDLLTLQRRWTADLASPPTDNERAGAVRVVASVASQWRRLAGSTLPHSVLDQVDAVLRDAPAGPAPPPALLDAVGAAARDGQARVAGGPVYLFGGPIRLPTPSGVRVVTSSDREADALGPARPRSWDEDEWSQLVSGDLGPWVAAVADGRVVSLTHTPKPMLPIAAECGVWTDPAFRGKGLATVTAAQWRELVARDGRHLFYSADHRNAASHAVARRLGLRRLGWQWTISAEPWVEGDAWGQALLDHFHAGWTPTPELETARGGVGEAMHPQWFFREFDEWDWWERELLLLGAQGPALDLGAGGGRTSLWLQEQGIDVTAVDSSPGAVEVCRSRGLVDVRLGDLNDPPKDKRWRCILLLCGNLGLGGSWDGCRRLLTRLAELAAPDAVLIGDTVEPGGTSAVGLRIRYKDAATPWWRQHNIPVADIPSLIEGTGWVVDRHVIDLPDHAVLLRRP